MEEKIRKTTILFVDDEPRWTQFYIEELEACGYVVVFKSGVDEAWQYLKQEPLPTLLILDVMMPPGKDMTDEETRVGLRTGERFYEKIRQLSFDLPVFILTNVNDAGLKERFHQEQHCTFLGKIETLPHELSEMVRTWCGVSSNDRGGTNEFSH